jgi:hypothetical protein
MSGQGLSRREMLKRTAVAGAVFWSVPVIESVTSAAAAASPGGATACSWVYVAYANPSSPGTIFVAGYNKSGQNVCTNYSANPQNSVQATPQPTSFGGNNYVFTMNAGSPGHPTLVTFTINGASGPPVQPAPATCTDLFQSGQSITALNGNTILAYFYFGASTLTGVGFSAPTPNNSLLLPLPC